jgi:hypothetical protein
MLAKIFSALQSIVCESLRRKKHRKNSIKIAFSLLCITFYMMFFDKVACFATEAPYCANFWSEDYHVTKVVENHVLILRSVRGDMKAAASYLNSEVKKNGLNAVASNAATECSSCGVKVGKFCCR